MTAEETKQLEDLAKAMLEASKRANGLSNYMWDLQKAFKESVTSQRAVIESHKKMLFSTKASVKSAKDLYDAWRKNSEQNKEQIKRMVALQREINEEAKAEEKLRKIIAARAGGMKGYIGATNECISAIKGMTSSIASLGSAFGIQSITFSDLVKTSLDYRKAMLEASRSQNIFGRGAGDISQALQDVTKNTTMSKMQFLSLANAMMKTYVGIKPSMTEMANILGTWGEQMGGDYEKAQLLFNMQAKFPPLFSKMKEGLQLISSITDKSSATEKAARDSALKGIRAQIVSYGMLADISSSEMQDALQAITPLTELEKEYNKAILDRQKLAQKAGDLQLQYAEKLKPVQDSLLTAATGVMDVLGKFPDVTVAVAGTALVMGGLSTAITLGTTAMAAFGATSAVATGGLTLVIGGAIYEIMKLVNSNKEAKETAAKIANEQKIIALHQETINSLTSEQRDQYNKLNEASKNSLLSKEQEETRQKEILEIIKTGGGAVAKLKAEYDEILITVGGYQKAIAATTANLKITSDITEEFGGVAKDALGSLIDMSQIDFSLSMTQFESSLKLVAQKIKDLSGGKINLDVSGGFEEQSKALQGALSKIKDLKVGTKEYADLMATIKPALEDQKDVSEKHANILRTKYSLVDADIRQQEKLTTLAESRLDAERRLMESAQFGLGASVDMMQKQVDLSYKMRDGYIQQLKATREIAKSEGKVNDEELKRIESADTILEAQKMANDLVKRTGGNALALTSHWERYQKTTKSILDQQQKIYDLTKDIREGYLDAIREMAVGAGEFEKIIGMQETGVTQLMKAVKDVTGEAKLNTMALGGTQGQQQTSQGVGTDISGQYTIGGIQFNRGGEDQRNRRIYKYQSYKEQAEAAMRGEDTGARSKAGSATAAGVQEYLGAQRNEEITPEQEAQRQAPILAKEIGKETASALREYTEMAVKVGGSYAAGRFDVGGAAAIRANGVSSGSMGAALLNSSSGSRASFGGARPRSAVSQVESVLPTTKEAQKTPLPEESNESVIRRSIEKMKKQIEEEEKKKSIELENIYKINEDAEKNQLRSLINVRKKLTDELSTEKIGLEIASGKGSLSTKKEEKVKKIKDLEKQFEKINEGISNHQGNLRDRSKGTSEGYRQSSERISQLRKSLEEERSVLSGYEEEGKLRQMDQLEKNQKKMIDDSERKRLRSQHAQVKKRAEAESGFYGGVKWGKEKAIGLLDKEKQSRAPIDHKGVPAGTGAGFISVSYPNESKNTEQEEISRRTSFLRSQIGTVKPKKGQTQEDADFRAATKYFDDQHIEKFAKEDFERAMKDKEELRVKGTGAGSSKTAKFGSATVDKVRSSGYTSAAQERGMEATALAQSNYEAAASSRESIYGATGDESSGGGGPVITIRLADGLRADVEGAGNLRLEILQGSRA